MGHSECWDDMGFILASKYRSEVLKILLKHTSTPKGLAERTGIKLSHVSRTLRQLEHRGLIKCYTPDRLKGKIFGLTEKGFIIAKEIQKDMG